MPQPVTWLADQPVADAGGLIVHFLDMGLTKYGDCILCRLGSRSILIDGGHPGDIRDHGEFLSIPNQLAAIFGHGPPFEISLLVVTHCHSDHIGCLPAMVSQNIIKPKWALVADRNLGFGIPVDGSGVLDAPDLTPAMHQLIAALREEDHSDLPDDELRQFLADAAGLEDNYVEMLGLLADGLDNKLVRFGRDDAAALEAEFADFGLAILGPEREHLLICAEEIHQGLTDVADAVREASLDRQFGDATNFDQVAAYRALARAQLADASDATDAGRPGFALNDQSIVLQLNTGNANVLLTGDMQFAEPDIDALVPLMTTLRRKIKNLAPFDLVKIAHHGSHNAFNSDVLAEMQGTPRYVISGGIKDRGHPDAGVLRLLKQTRTATNIEWARTDKNGRISVAFGPSGTMTKSRGRLNSSLPNVFDAPLVPVPIVIPPPVPPVPPVPPAAIVQQPLVPGPGLNPAEGAPRADVVRIIAEVPHTATQVTLTINVQPAAGKPDDRGNLPPPPPPLQPTVILAGGRTLPPLLFITSRAALARNVGNSAATSALRAIQNAKHALLDTLPDGATDPHQVIAAVRSAATQAAGIRGVVIVGGYDVVPAGRLDTLDAGVRSAIEAAKGTIGFQGDLDDFIVWSDALYGDTDGDGMAELPVSRIPDAHSATLLLRALQAGGASPGRRAGIRNVKRPFAANVFSQIPFQEHSAMLISETTNPSSPELASGRLDDSAVYLMLHGDFQDQTGFSGELAAGGQLTAINQANVAGVRLDKSLVFAGCCWGALTVRERAIDGNKSAPVTPLAVNESMALSFLAQGATAFIGCTGVHYSPPGSAPTRAGGPMHTAFWRCFASPLVPAEALFRAKSDYLAGIPYDPAGDAFSRATELKLLRQFTCLGLGW